MRILIVGSDKVYAIENFYKKYFEESGVDVLLFTAQNYFYEYYQRSLFNKLLYKARLSGIIAKINMLFKETVEQFKPDVIWIFKGMEITPESLKWAKEKKIKLANYNPDNPFIFSGKGSGNSNVTKSIRYYDLHFTYNLSVKKKLEDDYHVPTVFLPFGFDLTEELFQACANQEEILKVCFAGNPDAERASFIKQMAEEGVRIDLFGHNWESYIKNPLISIFPPAYGESFWMLLRRYRVQLNLMRQHNEDSHNMRTFEVPAVGGIMLAPFTPEHELFFENGKEAFWFTEVHDAVNRANELIGLNNSGAEYIRQNARTRSLQSGYSYRARANTALVKLKELVN
jgi:spore maturation protein CgeB